jgi:hypothetical protein
VGPCEHDLETGSSEICRWFVEQLSDCQSLRGIAYILVGLAAHKHTPINTPRDNLNAINIQPFRRLTLTLHNV